RTCIAGASDVYGLGITLFEMLTGRLPFDSESDERLAESHVREMPPSPRHFVPSLPRELAHLVTRMLAKSPDRRPSADELISLFTGLEIEFFALRGYNSANT
ncbi:MAG: protein kinase, partial [Planctomycetales bacterium]|nr:protein kinase [Planctomycetales bacterium]